MKKRKLVNKTLKFKNKLHFRSLRHKWIVISLALLITGSLLFNKQIGAFLGQRVKPLFTKNHAEEVSDTQQEDSNKAIKSACVKEVKKYIELNYQDEVLNGARGETNISEPFTQKVNKFRTEANKHGWSQSQTNAFINQKAEEYVWLVNSEYRSCLAENGLSLEDLLSSPGQLDFDTTGSVSNPQNSTKNIFEEIDKEELQRKQERAQECQQDWTEYNACLSKYNAELSEYNTCLMEKVSKPYKYCFKPYNSCSKPYCSF